MTRLPLPAEGEILRGLRAYRPGSGCDYDESLRRWATVGKRFPGRSMGYSNAAECLANLGWLDAAPALRDRAVKLFPDVFLCRFGHAKVAERRQDWLQSLGRWNVVLENFNHVAGLLGAARALHQLGRAQEAIDRLVATRMRYSTEVEVVLLLARLHESIGNLAEAERCYTFARERFPLMPGGYQENAKFLRKLGRDTEADDILRMAVDRFPDAASPLVEFAEFAAERQNWLEAAQRWQRLRAAFPDRDDGYLRGAQALQAAGQEEAAAEVRELHRARRQN